MVDGDDSAKGSEKKMLTTANKSDSISNMTNNGGNVEEHKCDVCNESPAMTYNEKQGAVCYDCRLYDYDGNCVCNLDGCNFCKPENEGIEWKAHEVITLDNDTDSDTMSDMDADADALASAGWGTDEDYGYYGDE